MTVIELGGSPSGADADPAKWPSNWPEPKHAPPEIQDLSYDVAPEIAGDIERFDFELGRYLDGEIPEDVFRVFRLTNGIYGQRQGGRNQMLRVKVPYGSITPAQLEMIGWLVDTYSRNWGHITTRQNLQFHFVQLEDVPEVMRHLASVGLSTREACGDTVRNVQGCHLAGACPYEVLDITAWAEATFRYFVRNPLSQRMPRKFKINFSGCETDCGQAAFNDAGVIATTRTNPDGTVEAGFKVLVAGGLGANPFAAQALEEFTPREELLATIESILRVFDQTGNRDNKVRARMKWVVDKLGWEETQRRVLTTRRMLLASATYPGGIPEEVRRDGDAPAGRAVDVEPTPVGQGVSVKLRKRSEFERWDEANVVRGVASGTVSAYAYAPLGDITGDQFRALAAAQRESGASVRLSNRQNVVFRDLAQNQLQELHKRLIPIGMAEPGAELLRDVVACPGADTCNLAVTQSRGLAKAIGDALEAEGLGEVGGLRINISGCTNSCGQHHAFDIGFHGAERRAHGQAAPGYQMLLGGFIGGSEAVFAEKALRLPAKNAPEAVVRVVRRFVDERQPGEAFRTWLVRSGGVSEVAKGLADLDHFPTPSEAPEFFTDFDEVDPYAAEVGESECAT